MPVCGVDISWASSPIANDVLPSPESATPRKKKEHQKGEKTLTKTTTRKAGLEEILSTDTAN